MAAIGDVSLYYIVAKGTPPLGCHRRAIEETGRRIDAADARIRGRWPHGESQNCASKPGAQLDSRNPNYRIHKLEGRFHTEKIGMIAVLAWFREMGPQILGRSLSRRRDL